jgi:hypothetical protein
MLISVPGTRHRQCYKGNANIVWCVESLFDLVAVEDDERRGSQSSKAGAVAKQGMFRGGLSDVKQRQINVKGDAGSCTGGAVK